MWWRVLLSRLGLCLVALCLVVMTLAVIGLTPAALATGYLAAVTPWLVWRDVTEHRLPNALVIPGIGLGFGSCAGEWLEAGRFPLVPIVAAGIYVGFLLVLHLIGGMGMGDVKLGAALGLASWNLSVAVLSPMIAFLVGGLVATVLLLAGRRGTRIAFGPYLLGGYWAAVTLVAVADLVT